MLRLGPCEQWNRSNRTLQIHVCATQMGFNFDLNWQKKGFNDPFSARLPSESSRASQSSLLADSSCPCCRVSSSSGTFLLCPARTAHAVPGRSSHDICVTRWRSADKSVQSCPCWDDANRAWWSRCLVANLQPARGLHLALTMGGHLLAGLAVCCWVAQVGSAS